MQIEVLGGVFLCLLLISCQDSELATDLERLSPEAAVVPPSLTGVDPLDRVAMRFPSFAGAYFDSHGDFVIRVVGNSSSADIQADEILDFLLDEHGSDLLRRGRSDGQSGRVRVQPAGHTFAQLREFQQESWPLLDLPGTYSLDLDEAQGKIVVTVVDEGDVRPVQEAAAGLAVPEGIVAVTVGGTPQLAATLTDKVRPIAGGLKIEQSQWPVGACTLGFIAEKGDKRYLATNSHCTGPIGALGGAEFTQGSSSVVAIEAIDPPFQVLPDCPPDFTCRFADVALAELQSGVTYALGKIKKTLNNSGSKTIVGDFTITSKGTVPFQGQLVQKVGMTSGWTEGTVGPTCTFEDFRIYEPNQNQRGYICQYRTLFGAQNGDSGAPVFQLLTGDSVELLGIFWGIGDSWNTFSPMSGIESDLGTLTVF